MKTTDLPVAVSLSQDIGIRATRGVILNRIFVPADSRVDDDWVWDVYYALEIDPYIF